MRNRPVIRYIILVTVRPFKKWMNRTRFELVWKDPSGERKIDDISYSRKKSRDTFL